MIVLVEGRRKNNGRKERKKEKIDKRGKMEIEREKKERIDVGTGEKEGLRALSVIIGPPIGTPSTIS